jgi:hypothetical protein
MGLIMLRAVRSFRQVEIFIHHHLAKKIKLINTQKHTKTNKTRCTHNPNTREIIRAARNEETVSKNTFPKPASRPPLVLETQFIGKSCEMVERHEGGRAEGKRQRRRKERGERREGGKEGGEASKADYRRL